MMNAVKQHIAILAICAVFSLTSCSTIEGVGKDIQGLGRIIEKSSSSASGSKSTTPSAPKEDQSAPSGAVVTPVR